MTDPWPIPPNTPEAIAAIARVRRMLRGERVDPGPLPRERTSKPIKASNRCEYVRGGVRCSRKGAMTPAGYRCPTHAYLGEG